MSDVLINPESMAQALRAILVHDGCSTDEATAVADHLVEASLSGHDSHGVIRIIRYHQWLKDGLVKARQPLKVLLDTGSALHLDGQDGMGQWLAREATSFGIARTSEHGMVLIALRRAGHIGRLGAYAEQACRAGLVSLQFVNVGGSRLVAPFGSSSRRASTAPVAIGVPNGNGDDFILDFATSLVAEGKALVAGQGGQPLPDNALVAADGSMTSDPRALYGATLDTPLPNPRAGHGALRTMGDHKGSGLALACELLGGALTGNGTNGPTSKGFGNGLLMILIDPTRFDDRNGFAREVSEYVDYVRDSVPAQGVEHVLVPGDKERLRREQRRAFGLPLSQTVYAAIADLTAALPVPISAQSLLIQNA